MSKGTIWDAADTVMTRLGKEVMTSLWSVNYLCATDGLKMW